MTNPTSNFGWQMPTSTDLVTDLPADFEVFGQAVDTDFVDLLGGTTGQVLSKTSATDLDFTWVTPQVGDITAITVTAPITGGGTTGSVGIAISGATTSAAGAVQLSDSTSTTSSVLASTPTATKSAYDLADAAIAKSVVTTAGDVIYRNATVPARLGIGTAGQVLTVNTGATAPEWKTPTAATPTYVGCALNISTSGQSIATNTGTSILFDTEVIDTDGFHSNVTNTDRITIPAGKAGKYLVTAAITMAANSTGARVVNIAKNGSTAYGMTFPAPSLGASFGYITFIVDLAVSDYITASMFHTAGTNLNVQGVNTVGAGGTALQATLIGV